MRFVLLLLLSLLDCAAGCRSNSTHFVWKAWEDDADESSGLNASPQQQQQQQLRELEEQDCLYQTREDAAKAAAEFLRKNVMAFDLGKLETLGFGSDSSVDVDGLSFGIVQPTVELALDAKANHTWTDDLPQSIFFEYVLNYANTNEARTNWRPLLTPKVETILANAAGPVTTVETVVELLNTHIWTAIAPKHVDSIVFVSGQTPVIYDPMSVMAFGYASCTGLATLFTNVLRSAGVAARVVGTAAWYGDRNQGNHNWVEVYSQGQWYFLEPSPSAGFVDTIHRNPCDRWFCSKDRFNYTNRTTRVYAARLDQEKAQTMYYPLAWQWDSTDVPGVDQSKYYAEICSKC